MPILVHLSIIHSLRRAVENTKKTTNVNSGSLQDDPRDSGCGRFCSTAVSKRSMDLSIFSSRPSMFSNLSARFFEFSARTAHDVANDESSCC